MGRQVIFYATEFDLSRLEDEIARLGGLIFTEYSSSEVVGVPVRYSSEVVGGYKSCVICLKNDEGNLRRKPAGENRFVLDDLATPLIDYVVRSYVTTPPVLATSGPIGGSRLWYQAARWEGEVLVSRSPEFIALAEGISKWVRKKFVRNAKFYAYIGPDFGAQFLGEPGTDVTLGQRNK